MEPKTPLLGYKLTILAKKMLPKKPKKITFLLDSKMWKKGNFFYGSSFFHVFEIRSIF